MRLKDLYRQGDRWRFTWVPESEDSFDEEREHMKEVLAPYGRRWHPEDKEWSVRHTDDIKQAMGLVFDNATWLFDQIERQQELFTRG